MAIDYMTMPNNPAFSLQVILFHNVVISMSEWKGGIGGKEKTRLKTRKVF